MTLSTRVRAHLATNPGLKSEAIAAALGEPLMRVGFCLRKLKQTGMVAQSDSRNRATFTLVRAPLDKRKTPEELRAAQQARERRHREKMKAARGPDWTPRRNGGRKSALTPEQRIEHRREQQREYERIRRVRLKANPNDPQAGIRADLARLACKTLGEPMVAGRHVVAETYEQFIARGGVIEVLRGFVHDPDLRRRGQVHYRQGGAA